MKITHKAMIAFVLVCMLAVSIAPTFAQEVHTKTITEAEVNEAYAVTNPPRQGLVIGFSGFAPDVLQAAAARFAAAISGF